MVSVTIGQLVEGRLWGCTYPKSPRTLRVFSMRSEVIRSITSYQLYQKIKQHTASFQFHPRSDNLPIPRLAEIFDVFLLSFP